MKINLKKYHFQYQQPEVELGQNKCCSSWSQKGIPEICNYHKQ